MKNFEKHMKYFENDAHISKNLPSFIRSRNRRLPKLLEKVDFISLRGNDYHLSKAMPINESGFLVKFLRDNDNSKVYLSEVENETVPTVKLLAKSCKKAVIAIKEAVKTKFLILSKSTFEGPII